MTVIIGDSGEVTLPQGNILGAASENGLCTHRIIHPRFDGARYSMVLEHEGGVSESVSITDGMMTLGGDILGSEGAVRAQFRADLGGDNVGNSFRSEVFSVRVCPSL